MSETKFNNNIDVSGNINMSGNLVATQTWANSQFSGASIGSIDTLSDVDTTTNAPSSGQVLKWNGSNWIPQNDAAGSGGISLTDLSVGSEGSASGDGAISYNNSSGVFTYTPPDINSSVDTHLNQSNPTSGYVLSWNGSDYAWVAQTGGGGTPGGSTTQVQFNNAGAFGGDSDFTYNSTTNTLTVPNITATNLNVTGSGSTTISAGANIELDATNRVLVTDTPFRLASFTTTTRNAISSPANGDMIYNTTTNQLESYENSNWVATAGSGIASVVADTTPQLGGDLDAQAFNITTTGKILYSNVYSAEVDLPSASTYHGMFAHVHGTGKAYYAHAGAWVRLADYSEVSGASGIASVAADTTPQLGGDLDVNGKTIAHTFTIGSNGSSDYTFSDAGNIWFPTTENDPVLYLRRGEQYIFVNNSGGSHPFEIRASNGGSAYSTGVTNNGASSGNIVFKVPMSAPSTLYYQCTIHSGMGNTINIV
jgi:hypothetical protein